MLFFFLLSTAPPVSLSSQYLPTPHVGLPINRHAISSLSRLPFAPPPTHNSNFSRESNNDSHPRGFVDQHAAWRRRRGVRPQRRYGRGPAGGNGGGAGIHRLLSPLLGVPGACASPSVPGYCHSRRHSYPYCCRWFFCFSVFFRSLPCRWRWEGGRGCKLQRSSKEHFNTGVPKLRSDGAPTRDVSANVSDGDGLLRWKWK